MRRRLHALAWVSLLSGVFFASCLARRDKPFVRQTDDDAGGPDAIMLDGSLPDISPDALEIAPHAVLGIDPPHGPFAGGTLVVIRGNGFESNARVWFGDVEVPQSSVTPVDPQRIQVVTPPGAWGAAGITVQNGNAKSTSATLTGGYTYDRFYATPASGPTSGGTIITLKGDRTEWDDGTKVEIDRRPCERVDILSPTELTCTTAPSDAGSKVLSVIQGQEREDVLDGFLSGNSDNGFRGGLSGQPLDQQLTVLAFDDYEGNAIPGVTVLVGDDVETGQIARTDRNGVATFSGDLGPKRTVTLAVKCFQPVTFFDVPVDHLTAYLLPVLSPECGDLGELPPGGGTPEVDSSVSGEVVWKPDGELMRRGWTNVPAPANEQEKEVAYVFRLSDRADETLRIPSASSAITPEATGTLGYKFYQTTLPGNFTMYALAGLENRSKQPPTFTAYAMGVLRGVVAKPGKTSEDVFIQVDVPLDHALTLALDPPTRGARGPDRVRASVAIQIQHQGYALLPNGVSEQRLPGAKDFSFVGVPPLVGTLAGARYVLGARAVAGGPPEPRDCTSDLDCSKDQACRSEKCQPKSCRSDADCSKDQACRSEKCQPKSCRSDADCSKDQECRSEKCQPKSCRSDADCSKDQECRSEKCHAKDSPPLSVIGSFSATSTAEPLDLGGFVPLPVLVAPLKNTQWDLSSLTLAPAGQSVDLTIVHVYAGGGLYDWTIVAPGPRDDLQLPSLRQLAPDAALPVGSIQIQTTLAHINDFNYGTLRYRELTPRGWNAYATDTSFTQH